MARPCIELTDAIKLRICEALRVGVSVRHAADYAGISDSTLRRWIKRGRMKENNECYQLWQHIEKARADLVVSLMLKINHAASKDWKAAVWKLERLYPKLYGKSPVIDADADLEADVEDSDDYSDKAAEG